MTNDRRERRKAREALRCPFCGGTDIRFDNHGPVGDRCLHPRDDVWSTCCYKCGATFPNMYSREALEKCWRRRPAIAELAAVPDIVTKEQDNTNDTQKGDNL